MAVSAFLARCREALGPSSVLTDPAVTASSVEDWTRRWRGATPAVLRPGSTEDVAAVVVAARAERVALVPQGGNTGLVGGAVPVGDEVVVDLRRLHTLGAVDHLAGQVTAGAGVTLAGLQAHLRGSGLAFAVDHAARDTATLGGMVATNAGGVHVLRHGPMRSQVVGLTAVLGTGAVVDVNPSGLLKDNTGYDLVGLLCGSEGTLGIVTAVRLRLIPEAAGRLVAWLGFGSAGAVVSALPVLRAVPSVVALEAMAAVGVDLVAAHLGASPPVDPAPPWALLVELAGAGDLAGELAPALAALGSAVTATALADHPAGIARLWRWRDAHSEAIARLGIPHKADVTLPIGNLAAFLAEVGDVVERVTPGAVTVCFGHLGDGNVHVNVVGPDPDDPSALDAVYERVLADGGSVSAEHGVGRAKQAWMARQRGPAAVDAMRSVKAALDPDGILNPHVLLPRQVL